ncbi:hypothetical protein QPK87_14390 [Kamptonema cortianum]|jgi:hypothetical protein|nr:hypothetical protein [Geitlerinema splendidum]MDK3157755.1 hypothetical protein [Kamptonema cortianum]
MLRINIIYLTVVSVIAINSLALAEDSDDFLSEGRSGSIKAIQIEKVLESPDKTFKADGRTYKILNPNVSTDLLREMIKAGESIRGNVQETLGPTGMAWRFHYDIPSTYDSEGNLMWSMHPKFAGTTIDFQVEDITSQPPAWYEFWR